MANISIAIFSNFSRCSYASCHYTSTQQRIQTLAENNAKLEVAIEKVKKV